MFLNTLDVNLAQRTNIEPYNLRVNDMTLEILSIIFEFKIAGSWHVSRFLTGKDQNKYVYLKLRRMWKARLLESFKVYSGSWAGVSVFYMLSKTGLKILQEYGKYDLTYLKIYPTAKNLLSWGLFKHESQVIELASLEVKNKLNNLDIKFKGEIGSLSRDHIAHKNIEVLTPDYTVWYKIGEAKLCIYTEFERTVKSKEAILKKIQRYIDYLTFEQRQYIILRFIFQTPAMEQSFWSNIILNGSTLLSKLRILTTNLIVLKEYTDFLQPIYLSERTVKLIKEGNLKVDLGERVKLFPKGFDSS